MESLANSTFCVPIIAAMGVASSVGHLLLSHGMIAARPATMSRLVDVYCSGQAGRSGRPAIGTTRTARKRHPRNRRGTNSRGLRSTAIARASVHRGRRGPLSRRYRIAEFFSLVLVSKDRCKNAFDNIESQPQIVVFRQMSSVHRRIADI